MGKSRLLLTLLGLIFPPAPYDLILTFESDNLNLETTNLSSFLGRIVRVGKGSKIELESRSDDITCPSIAVCPNN